MDWVLFIVFAGATIIMLGVLIGLKFKKWLVSLALLFIGLIIILCALQNHDVEICECCNQIIRK